MTRVHKPGVLLDLVRDMMSDTPRSVRKLAKALEISRDTFWRWRMLVLKAIKEPPSGLLQGIVKTDES